MCLPVPVCRLHGHLFVARGACQCGWSLIGWRCEYWAVSAPREAEGAAEVSHSIGFWCQHGLGTWKSLSICRVNTYTCNLQAAGCSNGEIPTSSQESPRQVSDQWSEVLNVANQGPRLAPSGDSPPTLPLVSSTLWAAGSAQACGRAMWGSVDGSSCSAHGEGHCRTGPCAQEDN